jgi:hypothetical protein
VRLYNNKNFMIISFASLRSLYVRILLFLDVTQQRLVVTGISGQPISAIFRVKQFKVILEDSNDMLSNNISY